MLVTVSALAEPVEDQPCDLRGGRLFRFCARAYDYSRQGTILV